MSTVRLIGLLLVLAEISCVQVQQGCTHWKSYEVDQRCEARATQFTHGKFFVVIFSERTKLCTWYSPLDPEERTTIPLRQEMGIFEP